RAAQPAAMKARSPDSLANRSLEEPPGVCRPPKGRSELVVDAEEVAVHLYLVILHPLGEERPVRNDLPARADAVRGAVLVVLPVEGHEVVAAVHAGLHLSVDDAHAAVEVER